MFSSGCRALPVAAASAWINAMTMLSHVVFVLGNVSRRARCYRMFLMLFHLISWLFFIIFFLFFINRFRYMGRVVLMKLFTNEVRLLMLCELRVVSCRDYITWTHWRWWMQRWRFWHLVMIPVLVLFKLMKLYCCCRLYLCMMSIP